MRLALLGALPLAILLLGLVLLHGILLPFVVGPKVGSAARYTLSVRIFEITGSKLA